MNELLFIDINPLTGNGTLAGMTAQRLPSQLVVLIYFFNYKIVNKFQKKYSK